MVGKEYPGRRSVDSKRSGCVQVNRVTCSMDWYVCLGIGIGVDSPRPYPCDHAER